ncbi:MAG: YqgE/AlgH family protein [Chlamydiales bacterium]|nr:YqgE/AlgH family protein [Chlamydiales bacterium]
MSTLSSGQFLIASPDLDDELFSRSVILLCEHSQVGSFGVIVNKPLEGGLPAELAELETQSSLLARIGGPIQSDQMMLLHTCASIPDQTLCVTEGVYLGGDGDFLQNTLTENKHSAIISFGYMAWGEGALEKEFLAGLWFLHPATQNHVFDTQPSQLWRALLREMGGKYATLSMMPDDLSLN